MSLTRKMGKLKSLIIGKVKDKASLMKARVVHSFRSSNSLKYIHLALLKSTTHTSNKPPNDGYVSDVVSYSNSRYGPAAFAAALWRLRVTKDAVVANKTLIVLHKLMKSSRYRFEGFNHGRNNLKFDDFCDQSSHITLELSQWVKWYGQYLDRLSWVSLVLESFPNLQESSKEKSKEKISVSSYQTGYIFRQTDCLVSLFEHICTRPEIPRLYQNKIVDEIRELVMEDYFAVMRLITIRLELLHERLVVPGVEPDVKNHSLFDLSTVMTRLEACKNKLSGFFWSCKRLADDFWCFVAKLTAQTVRTSSVAFEQVTFDDSATCGNEIVQWSATWEVFDEFEGSTNQQDWFRLQR